MIKLTDRQKDILHFISRENEIGTAEILNYINKKLNPVSRFSIVRDLNLLVKEGLIERVGGGRSTRYRERYSDLTNRYVDVDEYFKVPEEKRILTSDRFEYEVFHKLLGGKILSKEQIEKINELNSKYRNNIKTISPVIKKKELERFTVELSWKSSQIEGNTYTLLDTENLIKNKIKSEGHNTEEVTMILNHKKALDFINENVSYFKIISLKKIEELHRLIVGDLDIRFNIRKFPVGISGTKYLPLDNEYQIKEALENMILLINETKHPAEKAILAISLISYIQPFEDGNKRTARLLANAILSSYGYCPLSYRSVTEGDYKKATLVFYETHNLDPIKRIFLEQFEFAVNNYFRT